MAQLSITITVPDAQSTDILNTITDYLGYSGSGTRAEYLRVRVRDHLKKVYRDAKSKSATNQHVAQAEADADAVAFT